MPRRDMDHAALAASMRRPLPVAQPATQFSVVSLNILTKQCENWTRESAPLHVRAWAKRKPLLRELIVGIDADVVCAQEVEVASFWEEFDWLREHGYAAIEPRDGGTPPRSPQRSPPRTPPSAPSDTPSDAPPAAAAATFAEAGASDAAPAAAAAEPSSLMAKTAIFFKAERMELVWSENRSRALLAALRHRPSGQLVYIVNVHLEGNPIKVPQRISQLKSSLKRVAADQSKRKVAPADCAMVVAGDFNAIAGSASNLCLANGGLPKTFRDPWAGDDVVVTKEDYRHPYPLSDIYQVCDGLEPGEDDGRCRTHFSRDCAQGSPIDHVFYSHRTLRPIARRRVLTPEQLRAVRAEHLPSEWHPSDHLPVGAVFELLQSPADEPDREARLRVAEV
eukprot:TRINITY_DN9937_c0_g1_i1.p1 TRINITY_DN9937_c0_g1~~TRINITY_DN9937_c0_g1_i1.p1  ORF type:complete len:393 (+),score=121.47 TRINITY_DN9937_c0_g1_i1:91-1269(+)